jgi:hypothetical protein
MSHWPAGKEGSTVIKETGSDSASITIENMTKSVSISRLDMILFLVSWIEFAGIPIEAPLDCSVRELLYIILASLDLFLSSSEGKEMPTLLGPLERANLTHWTKHPTQ